MISITPQLSSYNNKSYQKVMCPGPGPVIVVCRAKHTKPLESILFQHKCLLQTANILRLMSMNETTKFIDSAEKYLDHYTALHWTMLSIVRASFSVGKVWPQCPPYCTVQQEWDNYDLYLHLTYPSTQPSRGVIILGHAEDVHN